MAKGNLQEVGAEVSSEAPKRTRKATGPRQNKPVHVLFRVTDTAGNPIEGAQLEIALATKDTNKVIELMDQQKDLTRVKVNL